VVESDRKIMTLNKSEIDLRCVQKLLDNKGFDSLLWGNMTGETKGSAHRGGSICEQFGYLPDLVLCLKGSDMKGLCEIRRCFKWELK